ncbi:MAG: preprotein translocase subunit SecE [Chlorobiota bacterium]|jgi:preprotein translocase subunit SecE|nr:preprotein translocase subunit SecE [Chlorobiota bacterium]QQS67289.1 MAG: preprotein translocase subunit SecE [Chlorobiota bacterium]
MKESIVNFVQGVTSEMKKVSWPTQEQLKEATLLTLGTCAVITTFVYSIDLIFTQLFSFIFG